MGVIITSRSTFYKIFHFLHFLISYFFIRTAITDFSQMAHRRDVLILVVTNGWPLMKLLISCLFLSSSTLGQHCCALRASCFVSYYLKLLFFYGYNDKLSLHLLVLLRRPISSIYAAEVDSLL